MKKTSLALMFTLAALQPSCQPAVVEGVITAVKIASDFITVIEFFDKALSTFQSDIDDAQQYLVSSEGQKSSDRAINWSNRWEQSQRSRVALEEAYQRLDDQINKYFSALSDEAEAIEDSSTREAQLAKNKALRSKWKTVHDNFKRQLETARTLEQEGRDVARVLVLEAMRNKLESKIDQALSIHHRIQTVNQELSKLILETRALLNVKGPRRSEAVKVAQKGASSVAQRALKGAQPAPGASSQGASPPTEVEPQGTSLLKAYQSMNLATLTLSSQIKNLRAGTSVSTAEAWGEQWRGVMMALGNVRAEFKVVEVSIRSHFESIKRDVKKIKSATIRKLELDSIQRQLAPWQDLNEQLNTVGQRFDELIDQGHDVAQVLMIAERRGELKSRLSLTDEVKRLLIEVNEKVLSIKRSLPPVMGLEEHLKREASFNPERQAFIASLEPVRVPAGTFMMGSNEFELAQPVRRVHVESFYLSKAEVTVGQYRACFKAGVCSADGLTGSASCNWSHANRERHPMNCVDWSQARTFAQWVGGDLPTEAQWEYAARSAGKAWQYPWGDQPPTCEYAVKDDGVNGCSEERTWPVCSKPKGNTQQGLCDMAGNVHEWVRDAWQEHYHHAPLKGSEVCDTPACKQSRHRVLRGGGWSTALSSRFRSVYRHHNAPMAHRGFNGFRVLLSSP